MDAEKKNVSFEGFSFQNGRRSRINRFIFGFFEVLEFLLKFIASVLTLSNQFKSK